MSDPTISQSSIVIYPAEDGTTRVACRFEDGSIWLTQALVAELFQVKVHTVNEHLRNIFDEGRSTLGQLFGNSE